ncbi:TPA: Hcp family type VI secretion system effector [bacterium]|nr:Hcp family type VI secretion system effector [bacterium]
MPMPFHLYMTGENQGNISEGACDIQGREDSILCQAFDHNVHIPYDIQTGSTTAKRVHDAIKITKVFDKSSPKLYQALCTGETITEAVLKFFKVIGSTETHYFSIKIEDGRLVSIKPWVPNCLDPTKATFTHMEDVSFTYRKITWTWEVDGIESEDDWTVAR